MYQLSLKHRREEDDIENHKKKARLEVAEQNDHEILEETMQSIDLTLSTSHKDLESLGDYISQLPNNCYKHNSQEDMRFTQYYQSSRLLIALNSNYFITAVSENISDFAGFEPNEVLGKSIHFLFDNHKELIDIGTEMMLLADGNHRDIVSVLTCKDESRNRHVHLHLHYNPDRILIIEVEEKSSNEESIHPFNTKFNMLVEKMLMQRDNSSVKSMCELAATELRNFLSFDRVMVYQFDSKWNGKVIVEVTGPNVPKKFLDLYFPASDVPPQVRNLFMQNRSRIIPDVNHPTSKIINNTGRPLDLTHAVFRGVSPSHIPYLRNMHAVSSVIISILGIKKTLWGFIIGHNPKPTNLAFPEKRYCDMLGQLVSLHLENMFQMQEVDMSRSISLDNIFNQLLYMQQQDVIVSEITSSLASVDNSFENIFTQTLWKNIASLMHADGVIYKNKETGKVIAMGDISNADKILHWLEQNASSYTCYVTNDVPCEMKIESENGYCCGILRITISDIEYLVVARNEKIQTIHWAGKPLSPDNTGLLLCRSSFEPWRETVTGMSLEWSRKDIDAAYEIKRILSYHLKLRRAEEKRKIHTLAISEEAEMKARQREIFLATICHELRTPIHAILGNLEYVSEMIKETEATECFESMQSSSEHLLSIISNVLDFSKLEVNKLDLKYIRMNLYTKVEKVVETLIPVAFKKGLYCRVFVPVNLPAVYMADPVRIRQILLNYMNNAIKFTEHGGVTLTVRCLSMEKNRAKLEFVVTDTGPGIKEEYIPKLFNRFYQIEGYSKSQTGTGLGLAICKEIVEKMGGEVGVDSTPGIGSSFFAALTMEFDELSASPYINISKYLDGGEVIIMEERQWMRELLLYYMAQWKVQYRTLDSLESLKKYIEKYRKRSTAEGVAVLLIGASYAFTKTAQPLLHDIFENIPNVITYLIKHWNTKFPQDIQKKNIFRGSLSSIGQLSKLHHLLTKKLESCLDKVKNIKEKTTVYQDTEKSTAPAKNKSPFSILLVEDNEANKRIGSRLFSMGGNTCTTASNGQEALELLDQKNKFDVILMDIFMPVMDGLTATRIIRERERKGVYGPQRQFIVGVTASTLEYTSCMEAGMDECLFKPFKRAELEKLLITYREKMKTVEES